MLSGREIFVEESMAAISEKSKEFFVLSSTYFASDQGSKQLVTHAEKFSSPKVLGGLQLSVQIPEFSFTAWVSTEPQFVSAYILKKRIMPAGPGSELACWGWFLSANDGPQLHYGAHDFYDRTDSLMKRQEVVGLGSSVPFQSEHFALMTVVVAGEDDSFYKNLELQGSAKMPRPVTDCFNNLEGVLVGDTGMTIAQLRFYPQAMTLSSIEEVASPSFLPSPPSFLLSCKPDKACAYNRYVFPRFCSLLYLLLADKRLTFMRVSWRDILRDGVPPCASTLRQLTVLNRFMVEEQFYRICRQALRLP